MLHTNHGELALIFDTFCRVWGAGGQATLTTRTEGGKLLANLELQLGFPAASRPQPLHPRQQRSKFASGHPEAAQHRHHRGPAAQAKSRARAAAHQAALAASSAAPSAATSDAPSVTPAVSAATSTATAAASAVSPPASAATHIASAVTLTVTPAATAATPAPGATWKPGAPQTDCMLKCDSCLDQSDLFFLSKFDLMEHMKIAHKKLNITFPEILHTNGCKLTKSVRLPQVTKEWVWRIPTCVKEF